MDNSPGLERRKSRARKWAGRAPAGWAAGEAEFRISSLVRAQKDRVTRAAAGATCGAAKKVDADGSAGELGSVRPTRFQDGMHVATLRGCGGLYASLRDRPTDDKGERVDKVFANFGAAKLSRRPEVNVRVSSYTREPSVERRLVYISCCDRLQAF